jgi:hypothetical protein
MKRLNVEFLVWLALLLAATHAAAQPGTAGAGGGPEDIVRKLYRQVVKRQPQGIPWGADKKAIWPFLSKRLIQRLEVTRACEADQIRHLKLEEEKLRREHPDEAKMIALKPATWDEDGLFSGGNEEGVPAAATISRIESQDNKSSQVYVKLTYRETFQTYGRSPNPADTFSWFVAAVVIFEEGHYLVDDVLFFKEHSTEVETRLSEMLSQGCNGPKWIGYAASRASSLLGTRLLSPIAED